MNDNIKLLTKFQRDLKTNLRVFPSLHFEGKIFDEQAYEEDDSLKYASLETFISELYQDEYLILTLDPTNTLDSRFNILNSFIDFISKINDPLKRERLARIFFLKEIPLQRYLHREDGVARDIYFLYAYGSQTVLRKIDSSNPEDDYESFQDLNELDESFVEVNEGEVRLNSSYQPLFDYDEFEKIISFSHDNEGPSSDVARIEAYLKILINEDDEENIHQKMMFIVKNISFETASLSSGSSANDLQREFYTNLFKLEESLYLYHQEGLSEDKILVMMNKTNDLPPYLGVEKDNHFMRSLTINYPNVELRRKVIEIIIDDLKTKTNYFKDYKFTLDDSFVTLTSEQSLITIKNLFDFIKENDSYLFDDKNEPYPPLKVYNMFLNGIPDKNPWEDPSIFSKIKGLESKINDKLKGQEDAVKTIVNVLSSAALGINKINNEHAPQAILYLAGPTGTGKTEVVKIIAKEIFGSEEKIHRFDMSEYSHSNDDTKLFGAPPGYVGYESGGQLTNAAREDPFSIFLFDEVEKATGSIFDKFLQIWSDGRMTDGLGRTVSFANSIIIMTSNEGMRTPTIKNEFNQDIVDPKLNQEYINKRINPSLANMETLLSVEDNKTAGSDTDEYQVTLHNVKEYHDHLERFVKTNLAYFFSNKLNRKELYGRLSSSIVVYNYISKEATKAIINNTYKKVTKAYYDKYGFSFDEDNKKIIIDYLNRKANDNKETEYGGRGINNMIDSLFTRKVAEFIMDNTSKTNSLESLEGRKIKVAISSDDSVTFEVINE